MGTLDFGALVKGFCDSRQIEISDEDAATLGLWFKVALPSYLERRAGDAALQAAKVAVSSRERERDREIAELRSERDQLLRDIDSLTDRLAASTQRVAPPEPLVERIFGLLESAGPDGLKRSEIRQKLGSNAWAASRINDALAALSADGRVTMTRTSTNTPGRTPEVWKAQTTTDVLGSALKAADGDPGRAMRVRRVYAGMTQDELAQQAHVSRATVWRIERGGNPSVQTARKLADALGCDASELLDASTTR